MIMAKTIRTEVLNRHTRLYGSSTVGVASFLSNKDRLNRHARLYGPASVSLAKELLKKAKDVAALNRLGLVDASQVAGGNFFDRNKEAIMGGLKLANEMAKRGD
jgi:hypothetical protein